MDAITVILGIVSVLLVFIILAYLYWRGTSANVDSEWVFDSDTTLSESPEGMLTNENVEGVTQLLKNSYQPVRIITKQDPERKDFILVETFHEGTLVSTDELYIFFFPL